MHLWRKLTGPRWLSAHEDRLQNVARGRLVIIARPERKRLQLEVACASHKVLRTLVKEFGGRTEKWPRDWLNRFANLNKSEPLKIGKRLLVLMASERQLAYGCSVRRPQRMPLHRSQSKRLTTANATARLEKTHFLVIPASGAFGTGGHATTAMSLRLLEHLTRKWKDGWSFADLGTGTGILALAAKRFGAGHVTGMDNDPKAISIAKANARLNKIENVDFHLRDVRKWNSTGAKDVVAANLYSELLIEIPPKLQHCNWLILSGVLRRQEGKLLRALRRNKIQIVDVKRRGKWIAVLANCTDSLMRSSHADKKQICAGEAAS